MANSNPFATLNQGSSPLASPQESRSPNGGIIGADLGGRADYQGSGDGADDTRKCRAAIAARGADAVIPVRRGGPPWIKDAPGVDVRNETLRAMKRRGRTIWKKWSGYHRRRLVETKMHCFKLPGERVAPRTFDRQITELKVRAAVRNRFSQIGVPNTIRVA